MGNSPKYRREIIEAETKGGLKLHNIKLFDTALKLSWLKTYLRSSSKWTTYPKDMELEGVFIYRLVYIARIEELR